MILCEARLAEKAGMRVHQYKNLYFSILISTSICLSLNPAFFLSIVSTSRTVKLCHGGEGKRVEQVHLFKWLKVVCFLKADLKLTRFLLWCCSDVSFWPVLGVQSVSESWIPGRTPQRGAAGKSWASAQGRCVSLLHLLHALVWTVQAWVEKKVI